MKATKAQLEEIVKLAATYAYADPRENAQETRREAYLALVKALAENGFNPIQKKQ